MHPDNQNRSNQSYTLPFLEAKEVVAKLLHKHLEKSQRRSHKVLQQESPEFIAEILKLETVFDHGFQNLFELESFIDNYLKQYQALKGAQKSLCRRHYSPLRALPDLL